MNTISRHPLNCSVHTRLRAFHLKRFLRLTKPQLLLDMGCGLGYFLRLFRNCTGIGVDRDMGSIKFNLREGMENMIRGEVSRLPIRNESVDFVICSEVLEHLPSGTDRVALSEAARVLKPGGYLFVTVPALEGVRAHSKLRNLGHQDRAGGEFHYRTGYAWKDMASLLERVPDLRLLKKRYSMFLISELFMDLLKLVYLKRHGLSDHSDITKAKDSTLFAIYNACFPILFALFVIEDMLLASIFKGHILVILLQKTGK